MYKPLAASTPHTRLTAVHLSVHPLHLPYRCCPCTASTPARTVPRRGGTSRRGRTARPSCSSAWRTSRWGTAATCRVPRAVRHESVVTVPAPPSCSSARRTSGWGAVGSAGHVLIDVECNGVCVAFQLSCVVDAVRIYSIPDRQANRKVPHFHSASLCVRSIVQSDSIPLLCVCGVLYRATLRQCRLLFLSTSFLPQIKPPHDVLLSQP